MKRRHLMLMGAGSCVWPASAFSDPTSIAAPVHEDTTWSDPAGRWQLPLRIRWPAGRQPVAAIVHSHGLGGSREGGDVWGRAWCDAGFLVLHVQHPGSDTEALRAGSGGLRRAASAEQLLARVAHMRFVHDELLRRAASGAAPWSRLRADRISASGHSFGAQTVLAIAGRSVPAGQPALVDTRWRAFVAFSPAPGRGDAQAMAAQFGPITRPLLGITGSLDGDPLGGTLSAQDRARVYDGLPPGQRALLWLHGADHMSFAGNRARPIVAGVGPLRRSPEAAALEPVHHERVARLSTLWWRAKLLDDGAAAEALRTPAGLGDGDRWRMD